MIFGYARVSLEEQNLNLQLDVLNSKNVDFIYQEKGSSIRRDRPQLEELLKVIRKGDSIIVYKLDRISRSTKHLIELSDLFESKEVNFISVQDNVDTSNAMGRFFFRVMASLSELERDIVVERTLAGLKSARARGKKGGRPSKEQTNVDMALKMYDSKQYSLSQIIDASGLSKTTLYRYINNRSQS